MPTVGSYRGAAAICGTTRRTVKREVFRRFHGEELATVKRAQRVKNTDIVADVVTSARTMIVQLRRCRRIWPLWSECDGCLDQVRLRLGPHRSQPRFIIGGLRAEPPPPADPVDPDWVYGQGAITVDVEAEEVLLVHVVEGRERLVPVIAEAVGDPQIAGDAQDSANATE